MVSKLSLAEDRFEIEGEAANPSHQDDIRYHEKSLAARAISRHVPHRDARQ